MVERHVARLVLCVGIFTIADEAANLIRALSEGQLLRKEAPDLLKVCLEGGIAAGVVAQDILHDGKRSASSAIERVICRILPNWYSKFSAFVRESRASNKLMSNH